MPSSIPFSNPHSVRTPPFPLANAMSDIGVPMAPRSQPQLPPQPDLEGAQGLLQMRQSVEPINGNMRISTPTSAPTPTSINSNSAMTFKFHPVASKPLPASVSVPAGATIPKDESSPPALPQHPSHLPPSPNASKDSRLTLSTSSEENGNGGLQSDVFSVAENSDTISDPDLDRGEGNDVSAQSRPSQFKSADQARQFTTKKPRQIIISALQNKVQHALPQNGPTQAASAQSPIVTALAYADQHLPAPPRRLYDPSAPILPVHGIRCHCRQVPEAFLNILDEKTASNATTLATLYGACKDDLCSLHLNAFAKLATAVLEERPVATGARQAQPGPAQAKMAEEQPEQEEEIPIEEAGRPTRTGTSTRWTPYSRRKRTTSIPGLYEYSLEPVKRRRTGQLGHQGLQNGVAQSMRPILDVKYNEGFRRRVLSELSQSFTELHEDDWSRGETTNRYIHAILSKCELPNTDPRYGPVDAGFLSGEEAAVVLERGAETVPIFTQGQQNFKWDHQSRPIVQLFHRMEDLDRGVSVQIPSHDFDLPSFEKKKLAEIRERFLKAFPSKDPWNILDLRSPLPPSILPNFMTGENCQLLPRIRDRLLDGQSAERTKANREDWNEWTDLLEWVLMSEGGHNTAPHMDSHGWSTWITIQEGNFGFGWLSQPTEKEQEEWMARPLDYTGGNWRFVVLKPGQTVFFPSGTVHFVFRLHARQTLAVGGHLLQWTGLERWVQIILSQLKNPNITNEDLGTAPLKYVRAARKLVDNRIATARFGPMGGMPAYCRFLTLASVRT